MRKSGVKWKEGMNVNGEPSANIKKMLSAWSDSKSTRLLLLEVAVEESS